MLFRRLYKGGYKLTKSVICGGNQSELSGDFRARGTPLRRQLSSHRFVGPQYGGLATIVSSGSVVAGRSALGLP